MARVLLINPPWVIGEDNNLWKRVASSWPSLGLLYIAAVLELDGHFVRYLDCSAEQLTVNATKKALAGYTPIDYVMITATTPLIKNALKIAAEAKKIFKNCTVVLGGVHPSVMPKEVLKYKEVDLVVIDEGEETAREIVRGAEWKNIKGTAFKKNGKIIINELRPLIQNLDLIPAPAYHLIRVNRYYPAIGSYKRLPAMSIFATRGCPGRCTFCYRTFRGKVRKRSAENIVEEIKLLQTNFGIKEICFYDDTFTAFAEEIKKFCRIIIKEKIDLTWSCFTRADFVEEKLLKLMKEAGCHLILFGVESADEKILELIHKRISLEQVKKVVLMARRIGIETRASFMFGNQGETEESIKKTIDFALELDPDEAQFNITTPYPGTELFSLAKKEKWLKSENWDDYSISNVVMELPGLDRRKLQYYYELAHRKFYFRPKVIFRRLYKVRSIIQMKQEIKGALGILKFIG